MNRALFSGSPVLRTSRRVLLAAGAVGLAAWVAGCAHLPLAVHDSGVKGPSTIAGQVTSDRGAVIADAVVSLASKHAASDATVRRQTKTDVSGRFTFEQLPLGTYEIRTQPTGYKRSKEMVTVEKEGVVRANLKVRM